MTCIAGYTDGAVIALMADSAFSGDCLVGTDAADNGKLLQMGPAIVGTSGALRVRQVLRYYADPPALGSAGPLDCLVRWVSYLRELMLRHGVVRVKEGVDELNESRLLVALAGRLFEIDVAWQVVAPDLPYWAIGCAGHEARAAIHALRTVGVHHPGGWSIESILRAALEAAAAFDAHVGPPFVYLEQSRHRV